MLDDSSALRGRDFSWLATTRRFGELYWLLKSQLYFRAFFGHLGWRSKLIRPMKLDGARNIFVGDHVLVHDQVWLYAKGLEGEQSAQLVIGRGSIIGHFNHITCVKSVDIGESVLTADRVHISDNSHVYEDVERPILEQGVRWSGEVSIGSGTWLGEGVSVLGCRIGRHCVVGANAVVVTDVPDHCVVAGVPARIIRRYDPATRAWQRG